MPYVLQVTTTLHANDPIKGKKWVLDVFVQLIQNLNILSKHGVTKRVKSISLSYMFPL